MEVCISSVTGEVSMTVSKAIKRFDNYCREIADLERKLANGASAGKQAKRRFRLNDIRNRLLPQVINILS